MRLSTFERQTIIETVGAFDSEAKVYLFGSRTDDGSRGGDIDLCCLSKRIDRSDRRAIRRRLCDHLGEQKIDIVVADNTELPFIRMILLDAILLHE